MERSILRINQKHRVSNQVSRKKTGLPDTVETILHTDGNWIAMTQNREEWHRVKEAYVQQSMFLT